MRSWVQPLLVLGAVLVVGAMVPLALALLARIDDEHDRRSAAFAAFGLRDRAPWSSASLPRAACPPYGEDLTALGAPGGDPAHPGSRRGWTDAAEGGPFDADGQRPAARIDRIRGDRRHAGLRARIRWHAVSVPADDLVHPHPAGRSVHDPAAGPPRDARRPPARPHRRRDRGRARPGRRRHPRRRAPGADAARPSARRRRRHRGRRHRPDRVRSTARDLRRPPPADPRRPRCRAGPRLAGPPDRTAGRRRGPPRAHGRDAPPADVELAFFRVAQEALANAVKHGKPPILVRYATTAGGATLSIDDAGPGIEPDAGEGADRAGHFGLLNMQQRAEAIGAILDVRRWPAGGHARGARLAGALIRVGDRRRPPGRRRGDRGDPAGASRTSRSSRWRRRSRRPRRPVCSIVERVDVVLLDIRLGTDSGLRPLTIGAGRPAGRRRGRAGDHRPDRLRLSAVRGRGAPARSGRVRAQDRATGRARRRDPAGRRGRAGVRGPPDVGRPRSPLPARARRRAPGRRRPHATTRSAPPCRSGRRPSRRTSPACSSGSASHHGPSSRCGPSAKAGSMSRPAVAERRFVRQATLRTLPARVLMT